MTLDQLIEHLKELRDEGHGDKQVMFAYNYGDHWRTQVAAGVESAEPMQVVYSDYHQMHKVLDEDDRRKPGALDVIVLG
jgi:hypothetical protein